MGLPDIKHAKRQKQHKVRSGIVIPSELRALEKSPCCLNSKLLLMEIRKLIMEREVFKAKFDFAQRRLVQLRRKYGQEVPAGKDRQR